MLNTSKEFQIQAHKYRNFYVTANCTLADGTSLPMEKGDFYLSGNGMVDSSDSAEFPLGLAIEKTATLSLVNDTDKFSAYNFNRARFVIYMNLPLPSGRVEAIKKGSFIVSKKPTTGSRINLTLFDHMYLADKKYDSRLTFPATAGEVLRDCCQSCGIALGDAEFPNDNYLVQEKPENTTYRAVIGFCAMLAGGNARIDKDDLLRILSFDKGTQDTVLDGGLFSPWTKGSTTDGGTFSPWTAGETLDGGSFGDRDNLHVFSAINSLTYDTDDVEVTGVKTVVDETEYLYGTDGYVLTIQNPLISGSIENAMQLIGERVIGLTMRPFSLQNIADPTIEFMDPCVFSDVKGKLYFSYITNVDFLFNGYTKASNTTKSLEENAAEFYPGNSIVVEQAKKNAEKLLSGYDIGVRHMNELAANTLGYYYTEVISESGGIIAYRHDKPELSESKTVYKKGMDGFFVTREYTGNDATTQWKAGFDSNGDAVLNILYAIGIQSEWINTRGLTAKDNEGNITFRVDAQTGAIRMNCTEFLLAGKTIGDLISAAIPSQTQKDILDILTNNGADKGIYLLKEKLYISFSAAMGGELTLGGENNGYGILRLKNKYDWDIGTFDSNGIAMRMIKSYPTTINNVSAFDFSKQVFGDLGIDFYRGRIKNGDEIESKKIGGLEIRNYISSGIEEREVGLYAMGGTPHAVLSAKSSSGSTLSTIQARGDGVWVDPILATGCIACVTNPGSGAKINLDTTRIEVVKELKVNGNFSVTGGTKSKIVDTLNYGSRFLYCYEMPSPMFGDIGEGETDENGDCYVCLDDIFLETIAAGMEYQIFLQKEGPGDIWVQEKASSYFLVRGTPDLKFAWEVKAKQKDYELDRLEDNVDRGIGFYEGPESVLINEREMFLKEQEELWMSERQSVIEEREGILYETA